MKEQKIVDSRDIPKIFANIEKIHGLNSKIHIDLEKKLDNWNEQATISDVFLDSISQFEVYSDYLMQHHTAIVLVNNLKENKKIASFLQVNANGFLSNTDLLSAHIISKRIAKTKKTAKDLIY